LFTISVSPTTRYDSSNTTTAPSARVVVVIARPSGVNSTTFDTYGSIFRLVFTVANRQRVPPSGPTSLCVAPWADISLAFFSSTWSPMM
jgi:hypothetical protein